MDVRAGGRVCEIGHVLDHAQNLCPGLAEHAGAAPDIDQGDFLRELGLPTRAKALAERAPERAEEFEIARRRLTGKGDNEMGALFKAMAIANRSLARLPGFDTT